LRKASTNKRGGKWGRAGQRSKKDGCFVPRARFPGKPFSNRGNWKKKTGTERGGGRTVVGIKEKKGSSFGG